MNRSLLIALFLLLSVVTASLALTGCFDRIVVPTTPTTTTGADRDKDGVVDGLDFCPDLYGTQPNGCPAVVTPPVPPRDPDDDADGIPNKEDRCPRSAEDFDNFQDADGCPEYDNDLDGTIDPLDRCPNEYGPASNQGCRAETATIQGATLQGGKLDHAGHGDDELKGGEGGIWPGSELSYTYFASADGTAVMCDWRFRVFENKGDNSEWAGHGRWLVWRAPRGQKFLSTGIEFNVNYVVTDEARGHGNHVASMAMSGDPGGNQLTYLADQLGKDTPRLISITWFPINAELTSGASALDDNSPLVFDVRGETVRFERNSLEETSN